jgi:cyclic pyranopterin monophosphate synthase
MTNKPVDSFSDSTSPAELSSEGITQPITHLNAAGNLQMVDVTHKEVTQREATAQGRISMSATTLAAIESGQTPKKSVLETARLAGIMAAKQTAQLIPLCHPLPLTGVDLEILPDNNRPGYTIRATVRTKAETGVEMEALTAVSVAALTLYDMAKALEKSMKIEDIQLIEKIGGKSGHWQNSTIP